MKEAKQERQELNWQLAYSRERDGACSDWMPASVPGCVQLDTAAARAKNARKKRLLPSRMTKRFFKGFPPVIRTLADYFVAGVVATGAAVVAAGAVVVAGVVAAAGAAVIL